MAKELSGKQWVVRFPDSKTTNALAADFRPGCEGFIAAMRTAGATVTVSSTRRPPERAYLMFINEGKEFRLRQWSGWKYFLNDFLRRESVRAAWHASKQTYDTDFQAFMEKNIAGLSLSPSVLPVARLAQAPRPAPAAPAGQAS